MRQRPKRLPAPPAAAPGSFALGLGAELHRQLAALWAAPQVFRPRSAPGGGAVKVGDFSGLRKRMRAFARGVTPEFDITSTIRDRHVHPRSLRR